MFVVTARGAGAEPSSGMIADDPIDRRTVLKRAGAGALVAVTLAGCSGDGGGDGAFGGWMNGANNYDGEVANRTDPEAVTIEVGAGGGGLAFGPAAVRVSTGTTIRWDWTGRGGGHNVNARDGASFESDTYTQSGGHFTHTVEEVGTIKYRCDPHRNVMKGVVVVE